MNVRMFLVALTLLSAPAHGQGYAGLGTEAEGYAQVKAPGRLIFPSDHGAHPEFRIEWWYLTANLQDASGHDYGIQWTLFRQATAPDRGETGWHSPQVWMGHAALTTPERHVFAERFARGGIGQAGVTLEPFEAWIDNWRMLGDDKLDTLAITATGAEFSYDLHARTEQDLVLHGENGFSVKSERHQASYYYSQPFYEIAGELHLDGAPIPVTGTAWLDREWSSQPLTETQTGWDWLSLVFENGTRAMVYGLRDTATETFMFGTWMGADGSATALSSDQIRLTPQRYAAVAGRDIPLDWRLEIPDHGVDIETRPVNPQSWMGTQFAYWEGPIRFDGTHAGKGYLEMTGYE